MKNKILASLSSKIYHFVYSFFIDVRNRRFKNMSTKKMFREVYHTNFWGDESRAKGEYYSGPGSHDDRVVNDYVTRVKEFILQNPNLARAVDIGCGDFNIGKRVCPLFKSYIGVDIVDELIDFNSKKFDIKNVKFQVLDAINEEPPKSDVIFVREVLQHLKNSEIKSFLSNIKKNTTCLIVTEALPGLMHEFEHNLDRGVGPNTRFSRNSGVVLTSAPFLLDFERSQCLNITKVDEGILRTDVYFFRR